MTIRQPTKRQREVLMLTSKDLRVKEVASMLEISERTVTHHMLQACKRMGVTTKAGACCFAIREGWI